MGWEPATTYIYDDDGRLISSKVEVEWDDTERDWMLALQHHRTETICPRCGLPKEICRAQATGMPGTLAVEFERCHVTAAVLMQQEKNAKDGLQYPESVFYAAHLTPPGTPASGTP